MSETAKRMLGESTVPKTQPLKVIEATRAEKYLVCPHCNEEIHEKHTGLNEAGQDIHRDCGGVIEMPETDLSQVAPWLRASVQAVRDFRKSGGNIRDLL
jgi:hypothetical protein